LRKSWKFFFILLCTIVLHYIVFYASRTIFYNLVMLALFGSLYERQPILKAIAVFAGFSIIALSASAILLYQRDNHFEYDGFESLTDSFVLGGLNYHVVPPLILDAISKDSLYFNANAGYGVATFGFLADPVISLLPTGDAKSLMASKVLSAEAQSFTLNFDGSEYNAFATFLYLAVFDFGRVAGPAVYGLFFGFVIGSTLRRRDAAGFLTFVIFAYFVYFNSFTFFITGDWFWVLVFVGLFFRGRANHICQEQPVAVLP
jgi:hypothetical protein